MGNGSGSDVARLKECWVAAGQGSRSSVVRASTAKVGGLGFDSQWLPMLQYVSILIYHQLLTTSCCYSV